MEFKSSRSDTVFSFAAGFACGKLYLLRKYRDAHPLRGKSVPYGGWGLPPRQAADPSSAPCGRSSSPWQGRFLKMGLVFICVVV